MEKKKVLAFGTFDLMHLGHLYYLKRAKSFGGRLAVVVSRDKTAESLGKELLNNEEQRLFLVRGIPIVDEAFLGEDFFEDRFKIIEKIKPQVIVLGYDQGQGIEEARKELKARGLNVEVMRIKGFKPGKLKSSKFRQKIFAGK